MRVCLISHSPAKGGAERALLETVEVLKEHGVDCRVLLPEHGELSVELDKLGVPFAVIPYGLWMSWGNPSLLGRVKAAAKHLALIIPSIVFNSLSLTLKLQVSLIF